MWVRVVPDVMRMPSLCVLALAALLAAPAAAIAQAAPPVVCTGLAGCGQGNANVIITGLLPTAITILASLAGGGAVIAIAVAGLQLLVSNGDESKIAQARWAVIYSVIGLTFVIVSQRVVSAVVTETYATGTSDFLFGSGQFLSTIVRIILSAFNVVFVIVLMIAGYRMALEGGKPDQFDRGLTIIKWAVGGAIVTNAAYAAVKALLLTNL